MNVMSLVKNPAPLSLLAVLAVLVIACGTQVAPAPTTDAADAVQPEPPAAASDDADQSSAGIEPEDAKPGRTAG